MDNSNFGNINWKDFFRGLLYAVVSAFLTALFQLIQGAIDTHSFNGALTSLSFQNCLWIALATGLGYIKVKLFTNSDNEPYSKEKKIEVRKVIPTDPRLKAHLVFDSRDDRFQFKARVSRIVTAVHSRMIAILNQLQKGKCTAEAGIGCCGTVPVYNYLPPKPKYSLDDTGSDALYADEQVYDGHAATDDYGSSDLTTAKMLQRAGMIDHWHNCRTADDVLLALAEYPVIIGIPWLDYMFSPAADGRLNVAGSIAGYHELLVREVNAEKQIVWIDNSWGESWGVKGRAYMTFDDIRRLFNMGSTGKVLLPLGSQRKPKRSLIQWFLDLFR